MTNTGSSSDLPDPEVPVATQPLVGASTLADTASIPTSTASPSEMRMSQALPKILLWTAAAYAAVRMFSLFRYSVDVPYWDQWNFVDFLRTTDDGVSWGELWAPHNEHRVLIPNVVLLVLARLTHWNVRAEIALVHALLGVRLLIVLAVVWWAGRRAKQATWACVPLLAAFLLTRAQAENFMWGWQVTLALGALFTLLCCLVLVDGGPGRFALAALLALASQFSFASGVVLWPVGAVFIMLQSGLTRRKKLIRAAVWLAIGAVATFFYNRHLPYSPKTMPVTFSGLVEYSVKFLGAPLAPIRLAPAQLVAWRAGIAGIVLFALGMLGVWRTGQWRRWAPITMWGLTAPATAGVTALGRLGFVPVEQSMSSRYITMSTTMWAAAAVMLTATVLHLAGQPPGAPIRSGSKRIITAWALAGALLISGLSVGAVTTAHGWDEWAKRRQTYSLRDRAFLADESQLTPEHKSWMYPDPAMIDKQRPYLLGKRLTVFRKRRPVPTGPTPGGGPVSTTAGPTTLASTSTLARTTTVAPTTTTRSPTTGVARSTLPPTVPPNLAPRPSVTP